MKGSGNKMLKLNISDVITLHEGNYKGKKIYYIVIYNSLSIPEVYIYDREKLDLLLRDRNNISISEYNTYINICKICITTFYNKDFEPTYKTKARRIEYY